MVAENVVSELKVIDVHQPTLIILDEDQLISGCCQTDPCEMAENSHNCPGWRRCQAE